MKGNVFCGLGDAARFKSPRYKAGVLLIPFLAPLLAFAQTDPDAPIMRAYAFVQHDQPASARALIRPLLDSGVLQGAELGRAWTVLGVSYADQNDYREAQYSFEQAISVLRTVPEDIRDYAAALVDFGSLYRVQGQLKVSTDMLLRALHLYQQVGNHSGIARVSNALAGLVLEQGRIREGKRYLKEAEDEVKVAAELNDDDLAAIFSTQALFARADGNPSAEIDGCEHAIETLKRVHKVDNPGLAWRYVLLGIAYSDADRFEDALREMRHGLSILDRLWGRNAPRYLEAEIAYSRVLDRSGDHKAAILLRVADEAKLKDLQRIQCVGCTISAETLR